jgi:hypothetical protein
LRECPRFRQTLLSLCPLERFWTVLLHWN